MKPRTTLLQLALCIGVLFFSGCKSTKVTQGQKTTQKQVEISMCDQTIKYYSEKLMTGGLEINASTEIIINPSTRLISLTSEVPNEPRAAFETVIEGIDCNLKAGLTEGQAIYRGYLNQKGGNTTKTTIKVEAKDGSLTISNADTEKRDPFVFVVSKWEIVKE